MISVCIATYNGEKYIHDQLQSILKHLGEHDEIIISDDHSVDSTVSIIQEFNDSRIWIIKNKGRGVIQNFENAIEHAKGDYIFLSDQDDIWSENKIEICIQNFNRGYDLILSDCTMFDSETNQIFNESFFEFNKSKKGVIKNIMKNSYIGCCMAFNKKVKEAVIPFPKNIPMHDSWIGIVSEIYFNVNFNTNKLISHRKHSLNASHTSTGKSKYSLRKKISFRIYLVYYLLQKVLKR
jgi:glycosyltransferase involved in cell wall biosynthesis